MNWASAALAACVANLCWSDVVFALEISHLGLPFSLVVSTQQGQFHHLVLVVAHRRTSLCKPVTKLLDTPSGQDRQIPELLETFPNWAKVALAKGANNKSRCHFTNPVARFSGAKPWSPNQPMSE